MTNQAVGVNHFNKTTIKALATKGVTVIGTTAIPDEKGSFTNSQTGYILNDGGTQRIRTYLEVLKLAS